MNTLQKYSTRKSSNKFRTVLIFSLLFTSTILLFILSLTLGSAKANLFSAISALFKKDFSSQDFRIVFYLRLPRAIGAIIAGCALSLSGAVIQAVLDNPMAAPNVIGVNAGAGLASMTVIAIIPGAISFLPIFAFLGALITVLIIYSISNIIGAGKLTITLIGLAIGSIITAAMNTIRTLFPDSVYDSVVYMMGGLSGIGFSDILPALAVITVSMTALFFMTDKIDIITLGEDTAKSLGLNTRRVRLILLILSSALAGAAVSYAGLIGFIGLISPHLVRRICGGRHSVLLPITALFGSALLLFSDLCSRLVFMPYEIPVGIILSLVGGPFFIFLVITKRRGSNDKM